MDWQIDRKWSCAALRCGGSRRFELARAGFRWFPEHLEMKNPLVLQWFLHMEPSKIGSDPDLTPKWPKATAKWPQSDPKWPQSYPKVAPNWTKVSQSDPKVTPSWPQSFIKSLKSIGKVSVFWKSTWIYPKGIHNDPKQFQSGPKSSEYT